MRCKWILLTMMTVVMAVDDYIEDWALMGARSARPTCVDIPANVTLCQNIGYDKMRLPNLLDHDTITEVVQQASSWVPLLNIKCHPDAQLFLCSLYTPVCLDRPIYPCRSLCEAVRSGCEKRMTAYGYPWPEMFICDKFPVDNDMCIAKQTATPSTGPLDLPGRRLVPDIETDVRDGNCEACSQVQTFENILDNFCRADFAMKVKVRKTSRRRGTLKVVMRKKMKKFKKGQLTKKELRRLKVVIDQPKSCNCEALDNLTGSFLLMGHKENDTATASLLLPWNREEKDFRKAVRRMRKLDCSKVLEITMKGQGALRRKDRVKDKKRKEGRNKKENERQTGKRRNKESNKENDRKNKKERDRKNKKEKERSSRRKSKTRSKIGNADSSIVFE